MIKIRKHNHYLRGKKNNSRTIEIKYLKLISANK